MPDWWGQPNHAPAAKSSHNVVRPLGGDTEPKNRSTRSLGAIDDSYHGEVNRGPRQVI